MQLALEVEVEVEEEVEEEEVTVRCAAAEGLTVSRALIMTWGAGGCGGLRECAVGAEEPSRMALSR